MRQIYFDAQAEHTTVPNPQQVSDISSRKKPSFEREQCAPAVGNEVDLNALSKMAKDRQTSTGPMRTQPAESGSVLPTPVQPIMPMVGKATKAPYPKERPTRSEAVRAAKAKIMRRNSLRIQRDAQKG